MRALDDVLPVLCYPTFDLGLPAAACCYLGLLNGG